MITTVLAGGHGLCALPSLREISFVASKVALHLHNSRQHGRRWADARVLTVPDHLLGHPRCTVACATVRSTFLHDWRNEGINERDAAEQRGSATM